MRSLNTGPACSYKCDMTASVSKRKHHKPKCIKWEILAVFTMEISGSLLIFVWLCVSLSFKCLFQKSTKWEAYISPPPPKSKPGPGPGNPDVLAKTKTFVFWHIVEISARYYRQIDRTDVAHLFCFQEIMKNWPRGPKKRPMTSKNWPRGPQNSPWLLNKLA